MSFPRLTVCRLGLALGLLMVLPCLRAAQPGFAGEWNTTYGRMVLKVEGTAVSGSCEIAGGAKSEITGTVDGDKLAFPPLPSVMVRHRYFDGQEDFARWCSELAYMSEPVVLYVSSHGTEQGVTVGEETLTGEFMGQQLRHAANLKLVHLGACLAMAGATPRKIREASGLDVPVSGYTKEADWAGSAVIDFSYLDLVLSRQLEPGEAARQVQKCVTFAGEDAVPDCVIGPTGFKIVE